MDEHEFTRFMTRVRQIGGDYAIGYQRGLRRHYHGESFGTEKEHDRWLCLGLDGDRRVEMGCGYRDGFAGIPPVSVENSRGASHRADWGDGGT